VTASGERIPVEINATLTTYRDETVVLSIARDVSERVARERELERKNESLEKLASIVSHDLRNPLNVAQGRLELAESEGESAHEHLDSAAAALDRMEALIQDSLDLAGHRHGESTRDPVDLADLIDQCWGGVVTDGATLQNRTERTVEADRTRLGRVFENLFRNAVEHADPTVTVTVGDCEGGFYVADDGPGIPEDARGRIFDPGYSTDDSGTGLGLTIVRDIVETHGWTVDVTAGGAGGARVEITGVEE
jgi:signal transduction histidine kinase